MQQDDYQMMAERFNEKMGFEHKDKGFGKKTKDQYEVFEEEVEELEEAFNFGDHCDVAEEMADVMVTLFVLADRLGLDLREAYMRKMGYNLMKTGETDENGKVVDDVVTQKPVFYDIIRYMPEE